MLAMDQQATGSGSRALDPVLRDPAKYLGSPDAVELIYEMQERQRYKEMFWNVEDEISILKARREAATAHRLASLGLPSPTMTLTGDEIVSDLWAKHHPKLKAIVGQPVKNVLNQGHSENRILVSRLENNELKDPVVLAVARFIHREAKSGRYRYW